jgi:hypothetical protein
MAAVMQGGEWVDDGLGYGYVDTSAGLAPATYDQGRDFAPLDPGLTYNNAPGATYGAQAWSQDPGWAQANHVVNPFGEGAGWAFGLGGPGKRGPISSTGLQFLGGPRQASNRGLLNLGLGVPQGDRASNFIEGTLTPEQQQQQASLQNAYNTTQMSGYGGGVINSSYGTPQTGTPFQVNDPSAPGASMPWQQPWGQPGYGGPMGGAPTGSYGAPTQGFGQGQMPQGSGWGGVFSNRNPWASS